MHQLIESKRKEIEEICRRFGVRRLEVFGSAARGYDFDPTTSDADFLVEFHDWAQKPWMAEFHALEAALSDVLGREIDLMSLGALQGMRNRFRRQSIEQDREFVYAN